jgi:hypothetical protein
MPGVPTALDPSEPEPIPVEEAVARLDDEGFLAVVRELWKRRGWTVEAERTPEDRYVDLLLTKAWPENQRGVVRVVLPGAERPVSGADVEHLLGVTQCEDVDWSRVVVPGEVARSVRTRGEKYGVTVDDREAIIDAVERTGGADLVGRHVEPPVAGDVERLVARLPDGLRSALVDSDAARRVAAAVRRRFPEDPSPAEVERLVFAGFRGSLVAAAVLLAVMLAAGSGSLVFWLLMVPLLLAVYAGMLPTMAVDLYLYRRGAHLRDSAEVSTDGSGPEPSRAATDAARGPEDGAWTPSWWYLASFLLVPFPLVAGAVYWYRRRTAHR